MRLFTLSFFLALALVTLTVSDFIVSAVPVPGKIYRGAKSPNNVVGSGFRTQDALTQPGDPSRAADPKFKKDSDGKDTSEHDKLKGDDIIPKQQGTCVGLSCNTNPKAVPGKSQWIDTDDEATKQKMKDANVVATPDGGQDGKGPGHVSLQSTQDMTADDLKNGINSLGWQSTQKKQKRATW